MRKGNWTSQQTSDLLERAKDSNNRSSVFSEFAVATGRKANSVRNYYYKQIASDKGKVHLKHVFKPFSAKEVQNLIREIVLGFSRGESVRNVCMTLADGDNTKMLRFQNKYRGVLAHNPSLIDKTVGELEQQGYFVKSPVAGKGGKSVQMQSEKKSADNVIMMPKVDKPLSDTDINNLFMGIIKLVKRNAAQEQVGLKSQIESLKLEIQKLKSKSKVKTKTV